jgi:2-polyprenyl-6-methoxyphenol hydroxylase-like FAD-dependent oxidoreductase
LKIACVGGGPAGLYLSILLKKQDRNHKVSVYERSDGSRTHGWGIVFWDDLVRQLQANDQISAAEILESATRWTDQALHREGRVTPYCGRGGYGIGRQRIIDILTARALELGVEIHYGAEIAGARDIPDADLVVAADGAGSQVRSSLGDEFGTSVRPGANKYIWLGTRKVFDAFTFTVADTPEGPIWIHAYAHDRETSTCVVECTPATFSGLQLDRMDLGSGLNLIERLFEDSLSGHRLIAGGSTWVNFRAVTNRHWHRGNVVLLGDAAHTTHFSIGSGTKLALQDAIALSNRLSRSEEGIESALAGYEAERIAGLKQPQSEAQFSQRWFENIENYLPLSDRDLFLILRERRSPLLPWVPAGLYCRLHNMVETFPMLKATRAWLGPRLRHAYSRWRA